MTDLSVIDALAASAGRQGALYGRWTGNRTEVHAATPTPDSGISGLEEAIRNADATLVGFYRFHDEAAFDLTAEELQISQLLASRPGAVVLLVRDGGPAPEGCFFFFEHGALLNFPLLTFPFDPVRLATTSRTAGELRPAPAPVQRLADAGKPVHLPVSAGPAPAIRHAPVAASEPAPRSRRSRARTVGLAVAACAFGGGAVYTFFTLSERLRLSSQATAQPPAPTVPGLNLRAEHQGQDLRILWDHNAPAVAAAAAASLVIVDASEQRIIPLSAEQVRFGSVLYSPKSDSIMIRLTTIQNGTSSSEGSVMVLINRQQAAVRTIAVPLAQPNPTPESEPEAPESFTAAPMRPFVPPASKRQSSGSSVTAELPDVALPRSATQLPEIQSLPRTPPPTAPAASDVKTAVSPASPPKSATGFVPPVLTQLSPVIVPREFRPFLTKPSSVSVHVKIDAKGTVMQATALPEKGSHALLLNAAAQAARRCRFLPARSGETPIVSEATITFRIQP